MENFLAQEFGKSQNYTNIPNEYFKTYDVKKGLRNEDGTGVRIGLTRVSDVSGYEIKDGHKIDSDGALYYRGYKITDIVNNNRHNADGFDEVMFLLLFGFLPSKKELDSFRKTFRNMYALPDDFIDINLLRHPTQNLMNVLQSSVLALFSYDDDPDNIEVFETIKKGLNLAAKLPAITCYAYQSKMHHFEHQSLVIHYPNKEYSIAENILSMLRRDQEFTASEAALLDTLLMIHADHGGGNNSTFTNVVVSSTGTDIYSSMAASIGSLKGPKHGGANIKVLNMLEAVVGEIGYTDDDAKITAIIEKMLDKDFFDQSGLVYGIGHAVYTISDPRAVLLKEYCSEIAKEKNRTVEYEFYARFEEIAKKIVSERKGKHISNNVDFYSGFAYDMLGIPKDLYTPLFVCARIVGWLAHNIENKLYDGRIMRPATKYIGDILEYIPVKNR